ncbi:hypothetical protein M0638_26750 [Roseomonas sp. NAR14]|uniref:Uncharacterized protein n=1 Tax=Roseomonas acroporae TaxID=2937791 RepID=A0A9X1YCL1_9PROT|nr:hypothetical protein [Roseomonas acroporae]MCK8787959.1 hypothetical protein [Roseomonas acroporae]
MTAIAADPFPLFEEPGGTEPAGRSDPETLRQEILRPLQALAVQAHYLGFRKAGDALLSVVDLIDLTTVFPAAVQPAPAADPLGAGGQAMMPLSRHARPAA